jgi:hypothetical protein
MSPQLLSLALWLVLSSAATAAPPPSSACNRCVSTAALSTSTRFKQSYASFIRTPGPEPGGGTLSPSMQLYEARRGSPLLWPIPHWFTYPSACTAATLVNNARGAWSLILWPAANWTLHTSELHGWTDKVKVSRWWIAASSVTRHLRTQPSVALHYATQKSLHREEQSIAT